MTAMVHQWASYSIDEDNNENEFQLLKEMAGQQGVKICQYKNRDDDESVREAAGEKGLTLTQKQFKEKQIAGTTGKIPEMIGKPVYVLAVPVSTRSGVDTVITCVIDLRYLYGYLHETARVVYVYILINAIVLSIIGFFRLVKVVVKPIDQLVYMTDKYMMSGEWPISPEIRSNEFGRLSFAMSSMLNKIDYDKQKMSEMISSLEKANNELKYSQQQMVRAEKMTAMGRLSAGLAHEIGNPLSIISGYLELLSDENLPVEDRRAFLLRATKELDRINKMIRQLLDCSRNEKDDGELVSAGQVCEEVIDIFLTHKPAKNIEITTDFYKERDNVRIGKNNLYQVILNCLFNSIDALKDKADKGKGGYVAIKTRLISNEDRNNFIEITIQDNGTGIDPEHLENVFDPFFTTKEVGEGTGLGLSVSYALIENAGGQMNIKSNKGEGTTVSITLPSL